MIFDAWNGYHSVPKKIDISQHSSRHGADTGTEPHPKDTLPPLNWRLYTAVDEIVTDIPNKTRCVDDALLWADNIEESFFQACHWLETCGKNGITLNPDKFVFAEDNVEFAGFEITADSVRSCKRYLQAVFCIPHSKKHYGRAILVRPYQPSLIRIQHNRLLKPGVPFRWDDHLDDLFQESKAVIASEICVRIFDKSKLTCLTTDWSKNGFGFWLFQKHCQCVRTVPFCCRDGWKITLVGNRFKSATESRYAPVERETLAVADALDHWRIFPMLG